MIDLQGSGPMMGMKGIHPKKGIIDLPIVCIRKNVTTQIKPLRKHNKFFAMYSTPRLKDNPATQRYAQFWCHCFRNPQEHLQTDKPIELMSESDFIDPMFVYVDKRDKKDKKWDFFYLTINNDAGFENKGLHQFIQSLKTLVLDRKLRGLVLAYFPDNVKGWHVKFSEEERKILQACEDRLTYKFGWMTAETLNNYMQACKFGFFPNTVDCSPRLLTESLCRNVPVMVNTNIWGGWKYVNKETGSLFDPANPETIHAAIDFMQKNTEFNAKRGFLREFGFKNSTERLATYVNRYVEDTGCTHMYFDRFGSIMKLLRRRLRREP